MLVILSSSVMADENNKQYVLVVGKDIDMYLYGQNDKVSLIARNFEDSSHKMFEEWRKSETFTDVVFVTKDMKRFPAHKMLLASISEFFKDLFTLSQEEDSEELTLSSTTSEVYFLSFLSNYLSFQIKISD